MIHGLLVEAESQPLQLVKLNPELGVAVTLTAVPLAKLTPQLDTQLKPEGEKVALPVPPPAN